MLRKVFNLSKFTFTLILLVSFLSFGQNHPKWSENSVIYEVNVRQYSEEGSFDEFAKSLPRLKQIGVEILWFMPIHPIGELNRKGTMGSYYSVKNYKEVNPEFGTLADFKSLVKKAHKHDMKVILDWVPNHTSWDNNWTSTHPEFFSKDENGKFIPPHSGWEDVIDLDYSNKLLWEYMLDAMRFWIIESDIDGFRVDVAAMVPGDFWEYAIPQLKKLKDVFLLAEASEPEMHTYGFDMTYNWQLKDIMNGIAEGKNHAFDLVEYYSTELDFYNRDDYRMTFTSNHDENSWHTSAVKRLGDGLEAFTVLTFTVQGMPLIYSGQEAANEKDLEFFEKDPIQWKESHMTELYTKLSHLKKTNKALWNGKAGGRMQILNFGDPNYVFSFIRIKDNDKVLVVFNFSDKPQSIVINDPLAFGDYKSFVNETDISITEETIIELPAWNYLLLERSAK